jgi:Ferritin-like domain
LRGRADLYQLEHLENVFYKQALQKFTEKDFADAGFDKNYFNNLKFIAHDEEAHVVVLTQEIQAAGAKPVESCQYNFGKALDDVKSFVSLGSVLEGVGVSAYLGGAAVVTSKDILTAAAAILVSEGLHQGIQRQGLQQPASANIVGTPASPTAIFTLASAFIASCPPTNMELPFKPFPTLTTMQKGPIAPNATAMFSVGGPVAEPFFMTFVSGIDTISVPGANSNGMLTAQIPAKTQGQTYVFVTKGESQGAIQDSQVLFGPAIVEVMPDAPTFDLTIQ